MRSENKKIGDGRSIDGEPFSLDIFSTSFLGCANERTPTNARNATARDTFRARVRNRAFMGPLRDIYACTPRGKDFLHCNGNDKAGGSPSAMIKRRARRVNFIKTLLRDLFFSESCCAGVFLEEFRDFR